MKPFLQKETQKSPYIYFHPEKGEMMIKGQSIPEDALLFYEPLYNYVNENTENISSTLRITVKLAYFNSSSSKCLFKLFKQLESTYAQCDQELKISWYCETDDEELIKIAQDFKKKLSIPIEIHQIDFD